MLLRLNADSTLVKNILELFSGYTEKIAKTNTIYLYYTIHITQYNLYYIITERWIIKYM